MNDWARMAQEAKRYKEMYPPGTRLILINMNDPFAPVPAGTKGTVVHVDDAGQIHMKWDNNRTLAIVPGEDSFRKLTEKELQEEKTTLQNKINDANNRSKEGNMNKGDIEKNDPVQEI